MSDAPMLVGIVVAHGTLADGLVDAVRQITGADAEALIPLSNRGLSPEGLATRILDLAGGRPTLLFTDLQSGSCAFAARRLCLGNPRLAVISGVNLPVLLDFVLHRDMPSAELIPRLLAKGRASIACAPADTERHGGPVGPGG
jgi:mannose/fructose-specific phosphotransferase system component IIA